MEINSICPYCLGKTTKNNHLEKKHPNRKILVALCHICNGHIPIKDLQTHLKKKHKIYSDQLNETINSLLETQFDRVNNISFQTLDKEKKKSEEIKKHQVYEKIDYVQYRENLIEDGVRSIRYGLIHVPLPPSSYKKYPRKKTTWKPSSISDLIKARKGQVLDKRQTTKESLIRILDEQSCIQEIAIRKTIYNAIKIGIKYYFYYDLNGLVCRVREDSIKL